MRKRIWKLRKRLIVEINKFPKVVKIKEMAGVEEKTVEVEKEDLEVVDVYMRY